MHTAFLRVELNKKEKKGRKKGKKKKKKKQKNPGNALNFASEAAIGAEMDHKAIIDESESNGKLIGLDDSQV